MREVGYICADVEMDFSKKMINSLLFANWRYYLNNQTGDFSTAIGTQIQSSGIIFRSTGLIVSGLIQVFLFLIHVNLFLYLLQLEEFYWE